MRFCRVCAVQLVMPNGVVTSGMVPPYSLPPPAVPMYGFTQSTGELGGELAGAAEAGAATPSAIAARTDLRSMSSPPRPWALPGALLNLTAASVPTSREGQGPECGPTFWPSVQRPEPQGPRRRVYSTVTPRLLFSGLVQKDMSA
jgi:hypothetical protein